MVHQVAPGLESWPQEALLLGAYKPTAPGIGFSGWLSGSKCSMGELTLF